MAQQTIGLGAAPDDGNGDDLRVAMDKVNDNFDEHYAEASWTPVLEGETTAGTPTYSIQSAHYTAHAERVIATFRFTISALGGMAGNLQITGLPFTNNGSISHVAFSINQIAWINFPTNYFGIGGEIIAATSVIDLYRWGDNVARARMDASELNVGGGNVVLWGSIMYRRSI